MVIKSVWIPEMMTKLEYIKVTYFVLPLILGLMSSAEVTTYPLHYHVGDFMPNGTILPVVYPGYNLSSQNYNIPQQRDSWISNLTPFAVL
jgi:hypothetical protein